MELSALVCYCFFFNHCLYLSEVLSCNSCLKQTDYNECMGDNDCNANAVCNNTIGSYLCACNLGYMGDGFQCEGKYS